MKKIIFKKFQKYKILDQFVRYMYHASLPDPPLMKFTTIILIDIEDLTKFSNYLFKILKSYLNILDQIKNPSALKYIHIKLIRSNYFEEATSFLQLMTKKFP